MVPRLLKGSEELCKVIDAPADYGLPNHGSTLFSPPNGFSCNLTSPEFQLYFENKFRTKRSAISRHLQKPGQFADYSQLYFGSHSGFSPRFLGIHFGEIIGSHSQEEHAGLFARSNTVQGETEKPAII